MRKPIIGLAGNNITMKSGSIREIERVYVNEDYVRAVEKAGGIPIILPIVHDEAGIQLQVGLCSGIIMTGGQDIHPKCYEEEARQGLGNVNLAADEYQMKLLKAALAGAKPVLAICRGHQVLNVVCGGTIFQDLAEMPAPTLKHVQDSKRYEVAHKIGILVGSLLWSMLGEAVWVNSYHHQCVKEVGKGLRVTARSADGAIEGLELADREFVVGVQWHPEMMASNSDEMLCLFRRLIDVAAKERGV